MDTFGANAAEVKAAAAEAAASMRAAAAKKEKTAEGAERPEVIQK